jgi:hypothetical protein
LPWLTEFVNSCIIAIARSDSDEAIHGGWTRCKPPWIASLRSQ